MEQHTITQFYASTKSKAGKEYIASNGKPYTRVAIQTDELPKGVWASTNIFRADDPILQLKKGDKVLLKVWKEGEWWNFKMPTKVDLLEERVAALEERVFGQDAEGEMGHTDTLEEGKADGEMNAADLPF